MAVRIPIYESKTLPQGGVQARATPLQETDVLGNAVARFGSTAAQVAGMVAADINEARVREADNQASAALRGILYDPEKGYLAATGKDAVDRYQDAEASIKQLGEQLAGSLQSPGQREMFDRVWQRRQESALNSLAVHAAQQSKVYNNNQAEARSALSIDDAVASYGNPQVFNTARATAVTEAAHGKTGAEAELAAKQAEAKIHLGILNNLFAGERNAEARAYFDANREQIPATYYDEIQQKLQAGTVKQDSLDLAFRLQSQHGTLDQQLAALKAMYEGDPGYGKRPDGTAKGNGWLGPIKRPDGTVMTEVTTGVEVNGKEMNIPLLVPTLSADQVEQLRNMPMGAQPPKQILDKAITWALQREKEGKSPYASSDEAKGGAPRISAEIYDATRQRLEHQAQEQQRLKTEYEGSMLGQAQDWILKNPGKSVQDMPQNLYSFAMAKGQLSTLDAFARRGGEGEGDDALYAKWRFALADTKTAYNVAKDFQSQSSDLRGKLSGKQWNDLLNISTAAMNGDSKAMNLSKQAADAVRAVSAQLRDAGLTTNAKPNSTAANDMAQFQNVLMQQIDQRQQDKGSALTSDEVNKIAIGLLQKGELQGSGVLWNDKVRRYQSFNPENTKNFVSTRLKDIPQDVRQEIETKLRNTPALRARLGIANPSRGSIEQTQEWANAIELLYQAKQDGVRF